MKHQTSAKTILLYLLSPEDSSSSMQRRRFPQEAMGGRFVLLSGVKAVLWIAVGIAVPVALLHLL